MPRAVGIDLGTTTTAVAVMKNGKPVMIVNPEGSHTTPAVVAFTRDGQCIVGARAQRQRMMNLRETVFSLKRFLGRRYDGVTGEITRVPYSLEPGPYGTVKIRVQERLWAPEGLVAILLGQLVDEAACALGESVEDVVITVPASFTHVQRQAVWDAGAIAGLNVLHLMNEPTAAALAYGMAQQGSATVMVVDLGGGTCEVSLLEIGEGVCEVRASAGDPQLGGDDFDNCLVDYISDICTREYGIDLRADRQTLQRLSEAAEQAKCELSSAAQTIIQLPYLIADTKKPVHLKVPLTRTLFETLTAPLQRRCTELIEQALADAKMSSRDIDTILLMGGASRIPVVRGGVTKLRDGRVPALSARLLDDGVAMGAALQAGMYTGVAESMMVFDATPLALHVQTPYGKITSLIERNTMLPCRKTAIFSTGEDNQFAIEFLVLQGEQGTPVDARQVGQVRVEGIRSALRGVPQIEVLFDLDTNGLLSVAARDLDTGMAYAAMLSNAPNLEREEVQRLRRDVRRHASQPVFVTH